MASALKSSFGSNRMPSLGFGLPEPAKPHSGGHSLLKNLLEDAVSTAKGIPFGMVQTVEHPIRTAEAFGKSYADYYGHGFGHFMHEFHAHPLQPLLDAISVPLILAGGAGFAIKGASAAAEAGRMGELGVAGAEALKKASDLAEAGKFAEADAVRLGVARHPALMKQAMRFQKGTSATTRIATGPSGFDIPVKAYSSNLFRRVLTKGADKVIEETMGRAHPYFSPSSVGARAEAKMLERHLAATTGRKFRQARLMHQGEKEGWKPATVGEHLRKNFVQTALRNLPKITSDTAEKVFSEGAVGRERWEMLAAPADSVEFPVVQRGGTVMHRTAQDQVGLKAEKQHLGGYDTAQKKDFITRELPSTIKTTQSVANAMKDANGNVTLIRKGALQAAAKELEGSRQMMEQIYKSPLKAWKFLILGMAPRYFVNNVIGNAGMYAAATNPLELTRGVYEGIRSARGIKAAAKFQRQSEDVIAGEMAKILPNDFVDEAMGYMQHGAQALEGAAGMGSRDPFSRLAGKMPTAFNVTEKVAYRATQRSSMMGAMTTMPDFRNLFRQYKASGMSRDEAFQAAGRQLLRDPRKAAAIEKRVADWAGQYYHLNGAEKMITALVPFYNWDRHALRFGKEQVLSRPVRSATLSQLGALGDKQAEKELGNVPDFLKGAIPVGEHNSGVLGYIFGQHVRGRTKVILTAGYNPLASAAEDARAIAALVGGGHAREAIGGQLNPVISGAIAGVTGQQLFSGAKSNFSGPVEGAIGETFGQLPQTRLLQLGLQKHGLLPDKLLKGLGVQKVSTKTKKGDPTLYTKDVRQQISSILGLNERDFSPKSAQRLYDTEQGIKKGRHKLTDAQKKARADARALKRMGTLKSQL